MSECRELKQLRCETKSGQEEILKILAEEIHKLENRLDALESAKCENCKTKQAEPKDAEETPNASGIEDVI
ncbi:MAG: hypothetical protein Q4E34_06555, partial [Synergistaceae bacterium]|nr:hypothetical protein [Synergistaceae bacterium]